MDIELQNKLASESFLTQEEVDMLMERRADNRTEIWTKAERVIRLAVRRLRGQV
jgi:hypothetical protein